MTSFNHYRTLSRRLLLVAVLAAAVGGAQAADRPTDVQEQMRNLLSGTAATLSSSAEAGSRPKRGSSLTVLDPQEQARELLLGVQRLAGGAKLAAAPYSNTESAARLIKGGPNVRVDAQEMTRRMILGKAA